MTERYSVAGNRNAHGSVGTDPGLRARLDTQRAGRAAPSSGWCSRAQQRSDAPGPLQPSTADAVKAHNVTHGTSSQPAGCRGSGPARQRVRNGDVIPRISCNALASAASWSGGVRTPGEYRGAPRRTDRALCNGEHIAVPEARACTARRPGRTSGRAAVMHRRSRAWSRHWLRTPRPRLPRAGATPDRYPQARRFPWRRPRGRAPRRACRRRTSRRTPSRRIAHPGCRPPARRAAAAPRSQYSRPNRGSTRATRRRRLQRRSPRRAPDRARRAATAPDVSPIRRRSATSSGCCSMNAVL